MATRAANRIGRRAPLSLRTTDELRTRLEDAASATGRSLTAELEHRLEQSFVWEAAFKDARAMLEKSKADLAEAERGSVKPLLHRLGWHPIHTPDGDMWAEPGVYKGATSGFIEEPAQQPPAAPVQAVVDLDALAERVVERTLARLLPPGVNFADFQADFQNETVRYQEPPKPSASRSKAENNDNLRDEPS